jgi:hypothetical protein
MKVKLIITLIILAVLGVLAYFAFGSYSDGAQAGTLVKLGKKGVLFKTYEGELNTYMFVSDDAAASAAITTLFAFSVRDSEEDALRIMQEALLSGKRVKLYYREKYFKALWNGDTRYFVYKAEMLDTPVR